MFEMKGKELELKRFIKFTMKHSKDYKREFLWLLFKNLTEKQLYVINDLFEEIENG